MRIHCRLFLSHIYFLPGSALSVMFSPINYLLEFGKSSPYLPYRYLILCIPIISRLSFGFSKLITLDDLHSCHPFVHFSSPKLTLFCWNFLHLLGKLGRLTKMKASNREKEGKYIERDNFRHCSQLYDTK